MTASDGPGSGIDPRGPRFGAGVTAVLLLVVLALGLASASAPRASDPAFWLFIALTLLFAWGAFVGIRRHPYGLVFRRLVRPRLSAPRELEDPAPPTFAQGIGLFVGIVGIVLHLLSVPYGLVAAATAAFVAAFLNSAFGYCLGCQLYLLLVRTRLLRVRGDGAQGLLNSGSGTAPLA